MNNLEIYKTFVSSTCHIDHDDIKILEENPDVFSIYDNLYGIKIFLGEEILSCINNFKFSDGLKLLIIFALSNDCDYLELDSDGPEYEEFPFYDW